MRIDRRRWNKTLGPVLAELRAELGLPDGCRLRAQLHSVLMYEQGQFFAPHKDSEKVDAMVGTLVVTLPSTSRGGRWWFNMVVGRRSTDHRIGCSRSSRSMRTASTKCFP